MMENGRILLARLLDVMFVKSKMCRISKKFKCRKNSMIVPHMGCRVSWGVVTTGQGRRVVPKGKRGSRGLCRGRGKRVVSGVILLF